MINDLTFNNPLNRALKAKSDDGKCRAIETARILINHIFEFESNKDKWSKIEERILMQAVPEIIEQYRIGNTVEEFKKYFRNQETKYSFF